MRKETRFNSMRMGILALVLFTASHAFAEVVPTESHRAAAREVYMLAGGTTAAKGAAEAMIAAMPANDKNSESIKKIIMTWCDRVFAGGDFENDMALIYAKYFSENELKELAKFYKTDLGQKITSSLPILMKEGAALGAKHGQLHQGELIQMLSELPK